MVDRNLRAQSDSFKALVERARAVPIADVVGAEVALTRKAREMVGLCPFHVEKTPSFFVFADHVHCFGCGAHEDAIGFVMRVRGLEFAGAVWWLCELPANTPRIRAQKLTSLPEPADTPARVKAILAECGPITDRTAAYLYLWSRGLNPKQPGLLAHPALWCQEVGRKLPALIAPITDSTGEVTAVQRIWCAERIESVNGNGPQDARAALQTRKKVLGSMGDGAVRLGVPGPSLGLTEGVETAIAASMLFRVGVWAVCGAARLGRVWLPPEVERVLIFGDNGSQGQLLAETAAVQIEARGIACQVVLPDAWFGDFNDQLNERRNIA